jgi:hypothetical protein
MLMLAVEVTSLMRVMVKDVVIKANITGNQCSAALLFNVKRDAEETLGSLRADKQIEDAAVYTKGDPSSPHTAPRASLGHPPRRRPRTDTGLPSDS